MRPKVINIKDTIRDWKVNPNYVYIGRPKRGKKPGQCKEGEEGYFGNPIERGEGCFMCGEVHWEAGSTLKCYERWLRNALSFEAAQLEATDWGHPTWGEIPPNLTNNVKALWGKTLVCFCKPNPCHGDILAQVCEELNDEN